MQCFLPGALALCEGVAAAADLICQTGQGGFCFLQSLAICRFSGDVCFIFSLKLFTLGLQGFQTRSHAGAACLVAMQRLFQAGDVVVGRRLAGKVVKLLRLQGFNRRF